MSSLATRSWRSSSLRMRYCGELSFSGILPVTVKNSSSVLTVPNLLAMRTDCPMEKRCSRICRVQFDAKLVEPLVAASRGGRQHIANLEKNGGPKSLTPHRAMSAQSHDGRLVSAYCVRNKA